MTRSAKERLRRAPHQLAGIECSPAPAGWDVALGAVVIGTVYLVLAVVLPRCLWRRLGIVELES